jgi:hypothetical protein
MMKVDSLDELRSAYAEWRKRKKHAREAVPDELIVRAQRAAKVHGVRAVVRATRLERSRLFRSAPGRKAARSEQSREATMAPKSVPAFSRLELEAPLTPGPRPVAEVETVAGVKLRVFEQTPEMMGLLSQVCGCGGPR